MALFQVFTYVYFEPDYGPTYFEPVFYADKERCPFLPLQYKNLIVDLFTFRTVKTSVSLQLRAQPNTTLNFRLMFTTNRRARSWSQVTPIDKWRTVT